MILFGRKVWPWKAWSGFPCGWNGFHFGLNREGGFSMMFGHWFFYTSMRGDE